MSGRDEQFLKRWSRLKRAAGADDPGQDPSTDEAGAAPPSPEGPAAADIASEDAGLTDAELCEKLGLPDPGSMQKGDDFKAFIAAGVPARLRNLALRRLWRVNPALGRLDDLIDYADDYTDAATALGAAQTTYQVGQGLRAHIEKLAAASRDKVAPDEAAKVGSPPVAGVRDEAAAEDREPVASSAPGEPADEPAEQAQGGQAATPVERDPAAASKARESATIRPRRMVFRSAKSPEN